MSNMSPQKPAFNRGIWKDLEALVRDFAITERKIVVVTGPILPQKKSVTIGSNRVTVPTHYYKVIFDLTPPRKMIGFILPNEGSDKPLASFAVTVDAVEKATGLNFFSKVPKTEQIGTDNISKSMEGIIITRCDEIRTSDLCIP